MQRMQGKGSNGSGVHPCLLLMDSNPDWTTNHLELLGSGSSLQKRSLVDSFFEKEVLGSITK